MKQEEIKFRAKNKTNDKWYYSYIAFPNGQDNDEYILESRIFWQQIEEGVLDIETLGQFTGLLDKNGKEIYEGDIFEDIAGQKKIISWDKKTAIFKWRYDFEREESGRHFFEGETQMTMEVIGNIIENLELLK